jgi:uncharacterized lipoprotein YajG
MTNHTEINSKISAQIIIEIGKGKSLQEAMNTILGEGAFQKIAEEIHKTANN